MRHRGEGELVAERSAPQKGPEHYYSQMLLRQYPWLREKLRNGEFPLALSYKKPETLLGFSLVFIGSFLVLDTLFHLTAFGGVLPGLVALLTGAALLYGGLWALCFAKRSYLLVTSERVLYQKIDLLGRPGKTVVLPRSEIKRARFLKSTVLYRAGRGDGAISLEMKNGTSVFIASVRQGENILGALR